MSAPLKLLDGKGAASKAATGSRTGHDHLEPRKSKELFIALSGPVGSGIPLVRETLETLLRAKGYRPVHIRVSDLFREQAAKLNISVDQQAEGVPAFDRISSMQTLGNELRRVLGDDMGGQLAVQAIFVDRADQHPDTEIPEIVPNRTAYIIDQLKHPREVALLRSIYGEMFYMIGVLCSHGHREQWLMDRPMSEELARSLMKRDKKESDDNGQQLDKTLQHADFFVSNSRQNNVDLELNLTRFIQLIHAAPGLTPNKEERGMFAAYSAGLRSACLSRQVGAAILDAEGNIISTGCNDVPAGGGGLYEPGPLDRRCFIKGGLCSNDKHKNLLREEITRALREAGFTHDEAIRAAEVVRTKTGVKDLIEFSRAVHAEMDAIVGIARTNVRGIIGSTLFTTVYPCHNCARHIIAAGISQVIYIEPYEKSLAARLHDDSIVQEPDAPASETARVTFLHFEGVAPQKYSRLFQSVSARKDKAGFMIGAQFTPDKIETEYLDDYMESEARLVDRLKILTDDITSKTTA